MNRTDKFEDIKQIADAVCDQEVTPEQVKQLEQLLLGNPEAQRFYQQYVETHVQMQADHIPNMEVIRRRMQVDEVVIRPVSAHATAQMPSINQPPLINQTQSAAENHQAPEQNKPKLLKWLGLIASLLLIAFAAYFLINTTNTNDETPLGKVISGRLHINGVGKIEGQLFYLGEYLCDQTVEVELNSGDKIVLSEQTLLKFYNATEISLKQGQLKIEEASGKNIFISGEHFKVSSEGGALKVDLSSESPLITTSKSARLIPKRWRPKHYWPFDSKSDRAVDFAGNATGIPSKGATRVKGLIGEGAFFFDNSADARINVGSGGGTAPATGSFSVTDGVTIEALIVPEYTGSTEGTVRDQRFGELDEIFRKDQTDKDHRLLLSFQNDKGKEYLRPMGDFKESLSFGLYLVGQGYHELKLPLDGKENRPTLEELKDGKPHHVVATYDVRTGLKAIYLDGKMLAHYQYPAGSKMLSGGSGMANIGNSPNAIDHSGEAFYGIIDEVAFYDFALSPFIIDQHYQFFLNNRNYFGLKPSATRLPSKLEIELPSYTSISLDPITGLPL
ncbi:LamG-like jellyroll fold domain-containing protein [Catenovulum maritimum]|uniref:Pentaxin domain-containing protein n=1 Tax=Catenovulum maritimum TaxID=1513271 RepID=A0A0J8GPS7_9ALTE|nr:LamG-like jellyroll fold domain-containing protein [Catenovulum maritimum]KMT64810.1 hypothetical protein XM47_12215 [Catenovulum maritimum]